MLLGGRDVAVAPSPPTHTQARGTRGVPRAELQHSNTNLQGRAGRVIRKARQRVVHSDHQRSTMCQCLQSCRVRRWVTGKLEVIERVRRHLGEIGVRYDELCGTRVESFVSTESRLNSLALEPWRVVAPVSSCQPMRIARVAVICCPYTTSIRRYFFLCRNSSRGFGTF